MFTCLVSCVFLVVNSALVNSFCSWMENSSPRFASRDHLTQIALFCLPVAMVFAEWWLFDVLVRTLSSMSFRRS